MLIWWTKDCPWLQTRQLMCLVSKRLAFRDSEYSRYFEFVNEALISCCSGSGSCWQVPGFHSYASLPEFCFTVSFCPRTWSPPPPFAIKSCLSNRHPSFTHAPPRGAPPATLQKYIWAEELTALKAQQEIASSRADMKNMGTWLEMPE